MIKPVPTEVNPTLREAALAYANAEFAIRTADVVGISQNPDVISAVNAAFFPKGKKPETLPTGKSAEELKAWLQQAEGIKDIYAKVTDRYLQNKVINYVDLCMSAHDAESKLNNPALVNSIQAALGAALQNNNVKNVDVVKVAEAALNAKEEAAVPTATKRVNGSGNPALSLKQAVAAYAESYVTLTKADIRADRIKNFVKTSDKLLLDSAEIPANIPQKDGEIEAWIKEHKELGPVYAAFKTEEERILARDYVKVSLDARAAFEDVIAKVNDPVKAGKLINPIRDAIDKAASTKDTAGNAYPAIQLEAVDALKLDKIVKTALSGAGYKATKEPAAKTFNAAVKESSSNVQTVNAKGTLYETALHQPKETLEWVKSCIGDDASDKTVALALALIIARKNGIADADKLSTGRKLLLPTHEEIKLSIAVMKADILKDNKISYTKEMKGHEVGDLVPLDVVKGMLTEKQQGQKR